MEIHGHDVTAGNLKPKFIAGEVNNQAKGVFSNQVCFLLISGGKINELLGCFCCRVFKVQEVLKLAKIIIIGFHSFVINQEFGR